MFILPLMSKAKGARAYVTEWAREDDALLLNLWETKTAAEIVPYFPGRTKHAIECRLCWIRKHLGVNQKGKSVHFNQEDDCFIRRHCSEKPIVWIAHQLGRTENAIRARATAWACRSESSGTPTIPRNTVTKTCGWFAPCGTVKGENSRSARLAKNWRYQRKPPKTSTTGV